MMDITVGGFAAAIAGSFIVGGAIGIILTSCLAAGRNENEEGFDDDFDDEE